MIHQQYRILILLIFLFISNNSHLIAQIGDTDKSKHDKVYELALRYYDLQIAATALYYKLVEDPNNIELKDSLATLYFTSGSFQQALVIGSEILVDKPEDPKTLEMVAICYTNLKAYKEALKTYEVLFKITNRAFHLYQVAVMEFNMQRFGECMDHLNAVINHPKSTEETIKTGNTPGSSSEIKLNAAAFNVMGVLYMQTKENELAKQSFLKSLEIQPGFQVAQKNLADVEASLEKN